MSNNDLISREWLEDAFDNLCCHNCKTCRNFRIEDSFYKCALIDNAPTVKPEKVLVANVTFDKDKLEEIVRDQVIEPIKNGGLVIKEEKPQGKWVEPFERNGKTYHKCNHCHISSELILIDNFCPNCGADMRGNK